MKRSKTERGFSILTFIELNSHECSLQKSSNAQEEQVWLGSDIEEIPLHPITWQKLGARMLLSRKLAAQLAKHLEKFSKSGEL